MVTPELLVLWDVDHTLLNAGGLSSQLYRVVFAELFGHELAQVAPMDVAAALATGARAVGVATGNTCEADLAAAGARRPAGPDRHAAGPGRHPGTPWAVDGNPGPGPVFAWK